MGLVSDAEGSLGKLLLTRGTGKLCFLCAEDEFSFLPDDADDVDTLPEDTGSLPSTDEAAVRLLSEDDNDDFRPLCKVEGDFELFSVSVCHGKFLSELSGVFGFLSRVTTDPSCLTLSEMNNRPKPGDKQYS